MSKLSSGGARSAELTLPGFHHDVGSSVYPLGVASPFFRTLPLERFGLRYVHPDAAMAHPLDDGTAITLERCIDDTAAQLGVHAKPIILVNVKGYFGPLEAMLQASVKGGFVRKENLGLYRIAPDAEAALAMMAEALG